MTRAPARRRSIVLGAIHPNAGLEAAYRRKLEALVDEMHASLLYWLRASYRANSPEIAQDAMSPAMALRAAMRKLAIRWLKRFDEAAPELAKYFATNATARVDGSLKSILKRSGFAVEFTMTREANDVMQATIGEQVGLIKSIASQHLSEVEGLVMRSVSTGRDLGTLTNELQQRYGVTRRRAALIARDQNNKATATITRVRQRSLGITQAKWLHSNGGKEPRKSHLEADGKIFDIDKGMLIDGDYIFPGQLINCRCVSRSILPALTLSDTGTASRPLLASTIKGATADAD
ncbi:SPP1 gp7 family putative phage head morphogenesis protein [Paraburkholderia sp. Clong3]|uniref:phage head morphogenesis protein n=1 Tax=Paraburkholderia sp. Clong3 TaxID=2991061 RepID=UPI003D1C9141